MRLPSLLVWLAVTLAEEALPAVVRVNVKSCSG